jgi:hypothetical protein
MNHRNRRWSWLLGLGLILALFIIKAPVEGGVNSLNISFVTSPTSTDSFGYVNGTANYSGAPPTFTVELINIEDRLDVYGAPVVTTTWLSSTSWQLKLDVSNLPDGEYFVRVTGTFSNGQVLVRVSDPGNGEPDCTETLCKGG